MEIRARDRAEAFTTKDGSTIRELLGLTTAPVLRDLSHRLGIELPITEGVCRILGGDDLSDLVGSLMGRRPTAE